MISDEAAILSADVEEVVAIKRSTTINPAPTFPINAVAAAGPTSPAETCSAVNLMGKTVVPVKAAAARPRVVDMANGIAYQANEPRM